MTPENSNEEGEAPAPRAGRGSGVAENAQAIYAILFCVVLLGGDNAKTYAKMATPSLTPRALTFLTLAGSCLSSVDTRQIESLSPPGW